MYKEVLLKKNDFEAFFRFAHLLFLVFLIWRTLVKCFLSSDLPVGVIDLPSGYRDMKGRISSDTY